MPSSKLSTENLSELLKVRPSTIRRGFCVRGEYMGLRPVKLPNGRLLWDREQAERLVVGGKVS